MAKKDKKNSNNTLKRYKFSLRTDFIVDIKSWTLIPTIILNFKLKRVEIRILCLTINTFRI